MNIGIDIRALGNKKLTGIGKYIYYAITHLLELEKKIIIIYSVRA